MSDVIFVVVILAFFAVMALLVQGLRRVIAGSADSDAPDGPGDGDLEESPADEAAGPAGQWRS